jgi:2-aminoadipate transaminase
MTIEDEHPPTRGARPTATRGARPTAHELARYERLFAARTRGMRSSAMREMMALTERPEVISLAGGLPDTSTFPPELYAKLMAHVAADSTARALQYGPTEGMTATMECIVEVMAEEGTTVTTDELIVTTGGQQVIDLVCKTLIDPGDVIVAEAPTYPGAVPTFGAYQADVVQIEMDDDGLPIDELEATLDRLQAENRRPKFIYTIPNFQNPGGVTMSLERRRALVALARERKLLVLEDNPYGLLRYEGEPLPTLYSLDAAHAGHAGGTLDTAHASRTLDTGHAGHAGGTLDAAHAGGTLDTADADRKGASDLVIYLGTFSKILSPGLRLGWAVAPRPVLEKLNLGKQGTDLCSSPVTQLFVAAYFRNSDWRAYLEELKVLYKRRRDAMLEALEEHFGGRASWTKPGGGLFIWVTWPEDIDTTSLLAQCEDVAFVPGRAAYMDGRRGASSMRLNFAGLPEDEIREGIRRIGRMMGEDTGMLGTLMGTPPARALAPAVSQPVAAPKPRQPAATPEPRPATATPEPRRATATPESRQAAAAPAPLADVVDLPRRRAKGR